MHWLHSIFSLAWWVGGGGGGTLILSGCIGSLSKFKNTPKALISGQKSTLIFKKLIFSSNKNNPTFIKTLILDEGKHVFQLEIFIIPCLFNGSSSGWE